MDKYQWLIKKQTKALKVFVQAKEQLASVIQSIEQEIFIADKAIHDLKTQAERLGDAKNYLQERHAEVTQQHKKVDAIFN